MKKTTVSKIKKHLKKDDKEFKGMIGELKGQIKDDVKLKKQLKK